MTERIRRELRLAWVLAQGQLAVEFGSSRLGYVWTVVRPFVTFAILYVVFGRMLNIANGLPDYPLVLLVGIVIWAFFSESTRSGMVSFVAQRALMRHIPFPVRAVPLAALVVATVTFAVDAAAFAVFAEVRHVTPRAGWLWLPPLFLELFLFSFAVSLLLATLYVRARDTGEVWALTLQALFYLTPIIYPLARLPEWAQKLELVNPMAQIIEDVRYFVLYRDSPDIPTASTVYGPGGHLIPLGVVALTVFAAWALFARQSRWLAESV